jgi:uroporphyrinogen-III synthase
MTQRHGDGDQFAAQGQALAFSSAQGLRPWPEVAAEYGRRTGEKISHQRAWQIGKRAEAKLRRALKGLMSV